MAIQKINLGTEPLGEGGDTYRSANTKINENFSNKDHAASRLVGVEDGQIPLAEDILEAIGKQYVANYSGDIDNFENGQAFLDRIKIENPEKLPSIEQRYYLLKQFYKYATSAKMQVLVGVTDESIFYRSYDNRGGAWAWKNWNKVYTTANTNKGTNGVLSAKSPVTHLYHDRVEHTGSEKELQAIEFVKQGVGDYLLKNTTGLAQEGWYIVIPHDANGNPLIAVEYDDKDGDINVRTYKRKFDYEQAKVVADHDNPMDIPETRWIDLRFNDDPSLYEDEVTEDTEPEEDPVVDEVEEPETVDEPSEESE